LGKLKIPPALRVQHNRRAAGGLASIQSTGFPDESPVGHLIGCAANLVL